MTLRGLRLSRNEVLIIAAVFAAIVVGVLVMEFTGQNDRERCERLFEREHRTVDEQDELRGCAHDGHLPAEFNDPALFPTP